MKQILLALFLWIIPIGTFAESFININAGQVGVFDETSQSRLGIEFRFKHDISGNFTPAVGLVINENNSKYIYTTLMYDFRLSTKWILAPSFGVVLFDNDHDIDLGNTIEFRSGLELAYELDNSYRVGFAAYHLSNGGVSSSNPGTESVVVSLSIPL